MRALQFATATANLASQNAFLFLATHGPIFMKAAFESQVRVHVRSATLETRHIHIPMISVMSFVSSSDSDSLNVIRLVSFPVVMVLGLSSL